MYLGQIITTKPSVGHPQMVVYIVRESPPEMPPLSVNSGLGMVVICVEESCFPTFVCMLFLSINGSLIFRLCIYSYLKNYIVKIRTVTP